MVSRMFGLSPLSAPWIAKYQLENDSYKKVRVVLTEPLKSVDSFNTIKYFSNNSCRFRTSKSDVRAVHAHSRISRSELLNFCP